MQPLFVQLDQAVEACRQADRGETGRLRVGYTGRASHVLLPRLVLAFRQRFPEVVLDIEGPLATGALRLALLDGQLDVALCFLPLTDTGIASRSFAASEFVLALPASHALAERDEVPLALLAQEAFVGYPANKGFHLRDAMDAECRRAGFQPRVVRESESSQVLLCLIAAGAGVSIIRASCSHSTKSAVWCSSRWGRTRTASATAWPGCPAATTRPCTTCWR